MNRNLTFCLPCWTLCLCVLSSPHINAEQLYLPVHGFWSHSRGMDQQDSATPEDIEITGSYDENYGNFWGEKYAVNYVHIHCDRKSRRLRQSVFVLRNDMPEPFPTQLCLEFQIESWNEKQIVTETLSMPGVSHTQKLRVDLTEKKVEYILEYESRETVCELVDGNELYRDALERSQ